MKLRLLISGMLAVAGISALYSAPDPDLFDGRFAVGTSDSTTTGGEAVEGGENGKGSTGTGEGSKGGEGGGESSVDASAENSSGDGGKTNGSGKSEGGFSSAGSMSSGSVSGRSFEEFDIGTVNETNSKIDINRSKEFDSQVDYSSKPSSSDAQNSDQNSPQNSSGKQDPYDGKGEADYGTSVPSGL